MSTTIMSEYYRQFKIDLKVLMTCPFIQPIHSKTISNLLLNSTCGLIQLKRRFKWHFYRFYFIIKFCCPVPNERNLS